MDEHGDEDDGTRLAERFVENRDHLRAVAHRMLGSVPDAEDAVQEAWIRLSRTDASAVDNLGGWLTTVVARVCLDMLRARRSRRETTAEMDTPGPRSPMAGGTGQRDPEHEAVLADAIGPALLVVLDMLTPAERLAFVLHDMFAVPFDEIAPIVNRSPEAARQLASRARRRVQGATGPSEADRSREREVVDAFLAASRHGDLEALIAVLDPEVVLRADPVAVELAASYRGPETPLLAPEIRGIDAVVRTIGGRARGARPALVRGVAGGAWAPGGRLRVAFDFTVAGGRIVAIELIADPDDLAALDLVLLDP